MNAEALLLRLFSVVRRLPPEEIPEAPYGWETRILAHWRESIARRKAAAGMSPFCGSDWQMALPEVRQPRADCQE